MSRRARRARRRRWLIRGGIVAGVLLVVWGFFVWHDLRAARSDLVDARKTGLGAVSQASNVRTAQGRAKTQATLDKALSQVRSAERKLSRSPALAATRLVPGLASQRAGLLHLVYDSRAGLQDSRQLVSTVDNLATGLKFEGGVPLAKLADLEVAVRTTGTQLQTLARSPAGLWGSLGRARKEFDTLARSGSSRLLQAADGLHASQTFLGGAGPRRYLVAIQNNAEMRDQGMVLSYAIVDADGGRLSYVENGPIGPLTLKTPASIGIPPGTEAVFGSLSPTRLWQSVNATADFSWSAQAMHAMYQQATGKQVDGVIAVDVPALAALLRATGPVTVPGLPHALTASNVDEQLLHDLYQHPSEDKAAAARETQLTVAAGKAVIERITRGGFDVLVLGNELGQAASGGHLKLWSASPAEEGAFERSRLGGGPAVADADRTFHLAVESRAPTKLDYYVRPVVRQHVTLDKAGTATVKTTVIVDNRAPVGAAPSEQLGPQQGYTTKAGDYIAWVLLWGPQGSNQDASVTESGLQLTGSVIFVPAGQKQQAAEFETVVPNAMKNGRLDLRYVPQPRLNPVDLTVDLDAPGWHIAGSQSRHVIWDRVLRIGWNVTR